MDVDVPSSGTRLTSDPLFRNILGGGEEPERVALPSNGSDARIDDSLFPDSAAPSAPPEETAPEENSRLVQFALRIAPTVVAIRVWDEFGMELSHGSGFFVSSSGLFLTDAGLFHPDFAPEIAYATVQTGAGENLRVEGILHHDLNSGIALLKAETTHAPHLPLSDPLPLKEDSPVTIISVHETKGLGLADAKASVDTTLSGAGWINIHGADSPGAPGSPVFDARGDVVGIVALHVPLDHWVNFAKPIAPALTLLRGAAGAGLRPLSSVASVSHPSITENQTFVNAIQNMREKRYKTATRELVRLVREFPRSAEPWALLGLASAQLGATNEAVLCQQKAVAIDPTTGNHWMNLAATELVLAQVTEQEADADAVLEALQKASRERPGDPNTWSLLADHLISRDDFAAADIALQQLVKLRFGDSRAFYRLGYVRSKTGDYAAAETALKRSAAIRDSADTWFLLGLVQSKTGDFSAAADSYAKTVREDPGHPNAWLNLADAYRRAGRENDARLAYREHRSRSGSGG